MVAGTGVHVGEGATLRKFLKLTVLASFMMRFSHTPPPGWREAGAARYGKTPDR